jgi:hypothetical protein
LGSFGNLASSAIGFVSQREETTRDVGEFTQLTIGFVSESGWAMTGYFTQKS